MFLALKSKLSQSLSSSRDWAVDEVYQIFSALTSTAIVRLWRQEAEKSLKSVGFIPAIKRASCERVVQDWKQQHFCYKRYYRLCSGLYIPAHTGPQPPTGQHPGANNHYSGGDTKYWFLTLLLNILIDLLNKEMKYKEIMFFGWENIHLWHHPLGNIK